MPRTAEPAGLSLALVWLNLGDAKMKLDMGKAWNDAMELLTGNFSVIVAVAGLFFFLPYAAMALLVPELLTPANHAIAG